MADLLVTGAGGVLGAAVVRELAEHGQSRTVYCSVRRCSAMSRDLRSLPFVDVVEGPLAELAIPASVGTVVHCAAVRRPSDPRLWESNVVATRRLARSAAERGCGVVFASSQSVYGQLQKLPVGESAVPRPADDYARSKLAAEEAIRDELGGSDSPYLALRLARLFGRGRGFEEEEGVLGAFLAAAAAGRGAIVRGDGRFMMDLLHVSDAARAVVTAAARLGVVTSGPRNVGSGRGIALLELAGLIREVIPSFRWTVAGDGDEGPTGVWMDIGLFSGESGWSPRITLRAWIEDALSGLTSAT